MCADRYTELLCIFEMTNTNANETSQCTSNTKLITIQLDMNKGLENCTLHLDSIKLSAVV